VKFHGQPRTGRKVERMWRRRREPRLPRQPRADPLPALGEHERAAQDAAVAGSDCDAHHTARRRKVGVDCHAADHMLVACRDVL